VWAHALQYLRKSEVEPERRKALKSRDLFLTDSKQEEFHHGGEGG